MHHIIIRSTELYWTNPFEGVQLLTGSICFALLSRCRALVAHHLGVGGYFNHAGKRRETSQDPPLFSRLLSSLGESKQSRMLFHLRVREICHALCGAPRIVDDLKQTSWQNKAGR